jgi:DNA-binding NtrC family response regulator
MPDMDGISVFNNIKRDWPSIPVILLTGHGTIQEAFETSKRGVFEYLSKPCDIEKLADMLRRAEESRIKKD